MKLYTAILQGLGLNNHKIETWLPRVYDTLLKELISQREVI